MTQDEIIEMVRQAGFSIADGIVTGGVTDVKRFAKLVAEKEREACAQILANTDLSGLRDSPLQNWVAGMLFEFIKAIRARGEA